MTEGQSKKPIPSRELIQRCGQNPDEPLGRIKFPDEMRMRPATNEEAQCGLNDIWPGDPVPDTRQFKPCPFPHEVRRGPYVEVDDTEFDAAHVGCGDCGAFGPFVDLSDYPNAEAAKDAAITLWNAR